MADSPRKKRVRHEIIMEILQNAKDGVKKTHIMYKSGLNYEQNEKYLNALKKAGFITEKNDIWKTTEKGLYVIEACKICQSFIENT